jgi:hypothetical protein
MQGYKTIIYIVIYKMTVSLSGKISLQHNLSGKNDSVVKDVSFEFKKIKIRILNMFVFPLLSKKWKVIKDNLFLLDQLKHKVDYFYNCFKRDDILIYNDLLNMIDFLMQQQIQLEDMEKKLYGTSQKDQVISMVYRTTMIKLKPEYELYDNILGKPKREEKQTYREDIIQDICKYMVLDNINYQKIHDYIVEKYDIKS